MTADNPSWDFSRSAVGARILVEVGAAHGVATATALGGTGLREVDLASPDTMVEAGQELAIARNLLRTLGDSPGLGAEAGARYTIASFGIWGFTLLTSATIREVVRLGTTYAALSFAFIRPVYSEEAEHGRVVFDDTEIPVDVQGFFTERELAKMVHLGPLVFGATPGFWIETRFDEARAAGLRDLYPGIRVVADAPEHALVFRRELLDAPLPQGDPVMTAVMEAQCAELLARRSRRRGVGRHVWARVLAELDDPPSMARIAEELHIDERTLRRQLTAEGTSFRELVDEVRATVARDMLDDGLLTVEQVAARLGYHDAAGFSRAYKRWTGHTPGSHRRSAPVRP